MIFILNDGNSISLFWKIGKKIYEDKEKYDNVVLKYADYLSYYYGNSYLYTRENIRFMKLFYLSFPIFNIKLAIFKRIYIFFIFLFAPFI